MDKMVELVYTTTTDDAERKAAIAAQKARMTHKPSTLDTRAAMAHMAWSALVARNAATWDN